jgi:hypothetical protein
MSGEGLMAASKNGDLAEATRLLLEGTDVNHKNKVRDKYDIIM